MRLIDGEKLYNELQKLENLAMQRVLDTPSTINGALSPMYIRYSAQTDERTSLKFKVADAPTIPAIPIDRIKQLREEVRKESDWLHATNRTLYDVNIAFNAINHYIDNMIKEYEE